MAERARILVAAGHIPLGKEEGVKMGRFCTNCGERLKEGANFCGNCGEAVEEKDDVRKRDIARRAYRPTGEQPQRLECDAHRRVPVQQQQSSGSGFGHFLAGTAIGAFLGNLFGSSASAHETMVNHNETIINQYEDDDGLMEERLGDGLDYDEDDSYDMDDDDSEEYGADYDDNYDDDGDEAGFFDDFGGGDDFGGDDFF